MPFEKKGDPYEKTHVILNNFSEHSFPKYLYHFWLLLYVCVPFFNVQFSNILSCFPARTSEFQMIICMLIELWYSFSEFLVENICCSHQIDCLQKTAIIYYEVEYVNARVVYP